MTQPLPAHVENYLQEQFGELTVTEREPEFYIRTAITKNSKGYAHESTVSVRWSGSLNHIPTDDENDTPDNVLRELHRIADYTARKEITLREALDAERSA